MPKDGQARHPGPSGNELGAALRGGVRLLPTPTANDDNRSVEAHLAMKARMKGGPRKQITSLQVLSKKWAREMEESESSGESTDQPSSDGKPSTGLRLSPLFVGWMMGTEICGECGREWTDPACPHSVTAYRFRSRISEDEPSSTMPNTVDGGNGGI